MFSKILPLNNNNNNNNNNNLLKNYLCYLESRIQNYLLGYPESFDRDVLPEDRSSIVKATFGNLQIRFRNMQIN